MVKSASGLASHRFDGQRMYMLDRDGDSGFVLADVCKVLTLVNVGGASARLDFDKVHDIRVADAIGRMQETACVSESGLYALILTSRKPDAKRFDRWVRHEALLSIRRTGAYVVPGAAVDPVALWPWIPWR